MRKFITIAVLLLVAVMAVSVAACDKTEYAHKISFNSNGGSSVEDIPFNAGDKVSAPTVPSKNGATFEGWYLDADFTEPFPFDTALEDKDYVAYARYNVTIHLETGDNSLQDRTRLAGEMMILPTPVSASGEVFVGWYSDKNYENAIDGVYIVPNDSVTIYAKWAHIEKGSAIDFLAGLAVNDAGHYTTESVDGGVRITPTDTKTAWSYVYSPISVPVNGYSLLHVRYRGTKDHTMTVKLEGGNVPAIEQTLVFDGEVQELLWNVPAANIATEEGQRILIFVDGNEAGNEAGASVTVFALEFCRLVEDGEEEMQVILFDSMGGSQVLPLLAAKDSDIDLPDDVTKPGFTFDGWYTDKECEHPFTSSKMPAGPTVLYAKWQVNTSHTVSFVTNCGQTVDPVQVKEGDNIPVPELSVEGWRFLGWFESNEAEQPHDLVMPASDITLYAHWLTLEQLSDKQTKQDLLGLDWTASGANISVTKDGNNLKLKLNTTESADLYASAMLTLADSFANALHIRVNGASGDSLAFIYNGKAKTVSLTGTEQDLWIFLDKQITSGEIRLQPIRGEGQLATQEIVVSSLELYAPLEKSIRVDTLGKWAANDTNAPYSVDMDDESGVMTITANNLKTGWQFVKYLVSELPEEALLKNAYRINMTFKGPVGHNMLIKLNNTKEYKQEFTGNEQEFSIDFDGFVSTTDNVFIIFLDSGAAVTEDLPVQFFKCEILFKQAEESGEYETTYIDLLNGAWENNVAGAYSFEKSGQDLKVTAQAPKGKWDVMRIDLRALEVSDPFELKVSVTGVNGKKIKFKYSVGGGKFIERDYTFDGTEQEFTVSLEGIDLQSNQYLQIFLDPGTSYADTDNTMEVTFHSMQLGCRVAK